MQSLKSQKGQGLVEYILVVALMGILAIAAVEKLSKQTQNGFNTATSRLATEFGKM